jgi:hypothetical protein
MGEAVTMEERMPGRLTVFHLGIAAATAAEPRIPETIRARRQLAGTACQTVLHWVT